MQPKSILVQHRPLATTRAMSSRRQARQRREFLYKKSLESQATSSLLRKERTKAALGAGKSPSAQDKGKGKAADEADVDNFDDEYAMAGVDDPKILLTTSRDPSSKLAQFAKEMRLIFPNATRINRGNYVMKELADAARASQVTDLVILHEHRGVPDAMVLSHFPHGPTILFTLHNVNLRHDTAAFQQGATVSEQYPHLIFENFSSKLGHRVKSILKYCFPVPRADSKRVMTFNNDKDFISFRHHVFVKTGHNEVQIAEVGPRFEMRPYEIRQGTIEQNDADLEWVLRPYMRTARKRNNL